MILASTLAVVLLAQAPTPSADDDVRTLVGRLSLEQYKTTLKGLTRFGDRRQGTKRNRDAVDWIEAQLQSVGCTTTERIDYVYEPGPPSARPARAPEALKEAAGTPTGGRIGRNGSGPGGASIFGYRARTGVNTDPMAQPDETLRELNREPASNGPRQEATVVNVRRWDSTGVQSSRTTGGGSGCQAIEPVGSEQTASPTFSPTVK